MTKSRTVEYKTWCDIKAKCYAPSQAKKGKYQAKNIQVYDRWINSFKNFLEDMGKRPENYSIERIDNNGNYSPENCIWIPKRDQPKNRGDFNNWVTYNGKTLNLKDWAREFNINYWTLRHRFLKKNQSFEQAIKI